MRSALPATRLLPRQLNMFPHYKVFLTHFLLIQHWLSPVSGHMRYDGENNSSLLFSSSCRVAYGRRMRATHNFS